MQFKKEGNRSYAFPARKCNQRKIITAKDGCIFLHMQTVYSLQEHPIILQPFFFKLQLIFLLCVRQALDMN
jgi:hypothetical protein